LPRFDYEIVYRPGKFNGKADALTRRPGDLPEGGDERLKHMEQVVLKPQNTPEQFRVFADIPAMQGHPSPSDLFIEAYETDPLPGKILNALWTKGRLKDITMPECTDRDGRIQYRGMCYVPDDDQLRLQLIQDHHHTALAGHPGRAKTFDLLDRQYEWKGMRNQVDQYVWRCRSCQRS